jgi:hypothetical protein
MNIVVKILNLVAARANSLSRPCCIAAHLLILQASHPRNSVTRLAIFGYMSCLLRGSVRLMSLTAGKYVRFWCVYQHGNEKVQSRNSVKTDDWRSLRLRKRVEYSGLSQR